MRKLMVILLSMILAFTGFSTYVQAQVFSDVNSGDRFYEHMNYLFNEGIIQGYGQDRFEPDQHVTRGQAALMIARALGLETRNRETQFTDVSSQNVASGAVHSATVAGIIQGYGDGTFGPEKPVTRGDMAIFLARAFKLTKEEALPFTDVPMTSSAYASIRKAIAFGIVEGYSDNTFKPNEYVTRKQFSAFLARALHDNLRIPVFACGYNPATHKNPDRQTVNCLITKLARQSEFPIPPEIVKAVATVENGKWQQFKSDGQPNISGDGGIGLMQITNTAGYDVERLKYDLPYNIQTGIEFLINNFKRSDLPKVGDHNPENLESWYFAVMAYNGIKAVNSPFVRETGKRNDDGVEGAYQEKVYQALTTNGLLGKRTHIHSIQMSKDDFIYGQETNNTIQFPTKSFQLTETTSSKELFKTEDDVVASPGARLRMKPNTQSDYIQTNAAVPMKILGASVYDERVNSPNQFVWYPVEAMIGGKKEYGYIASSNIMN
ncbi:S-layer homology domain-containing protein [Sporosarcina sp. HYO08]|uniref:S-layer homology domain-containing protein n=1 Tax=Sporosarcina sp. HYO08 TaxID=1759557 RepID=UPI000799BC4B|nr:S-layer homology domain-containing protein [Sporosarcina sp. HYO08]KXH84064.1 hypothetical protein AU377_04750 [Sporosarcina sp. HYO08]